MSAMKAMLWKEWRNIRTETLLLAALGVAWGLAWRLFPGVSTDVAIIAAATFMLPGTALLLGASTTAGDGALSFAAARPVGRAQQVFARIAPRLVAVGGIAFISLMAFAVPGRSVLSGLASALPGRGGAAAGSDSAWMILCLAGALVGCFSAAALVSACVERPLAAAFMGLVIVGLLWVAVAWLLGGLLMEPVALGIAFAASACVLLLLASLVTARRGSDAPVPLRSLARPAGGMLLGVAVVIAAWPTLMSVAINHSADSFERDLTAAMPAYAEVRDRLASRVQANEAHVRLVDAARRSGFKIANLNGGWRVGPGLDTDRAQDTWEREQIMDPSSTVAAPPASVLTWVATNQAGIEGLREALRSPELPRWAQREPYTWDAEVSGLGALAHVFNAHALACLARGPEGEGEALQDLEAEWRLAEALAADDGLGTGMFALSIAARVSVMLRKFESVPPGWDARLDVAPWREAYAEALLHETAGSIDRARNGISSPWDERRSPAELWFSRPMERWALLGHARVGAAQAVAVADPSRCGPAPGGPMADEGSGWWGEATTIRIDRLRAQMELTLATFAVRRARAADPAGAWPSSMPSVEQSACEGLRWVYTPGDAPSIHAEGEYVPWLAQNEGTHRPLSVELH